MGRDTPRYFVEPRPGKFYWQPSSELRGAGWRPERLSDQRSAAIARAIEINAKVDAWTKEGKPARGASSSPPRLTDSGTAATRRASSPGSCNALFDLYQLTDKKYPRCPRCDALRPMPDRCTHSGTKRQYDAELAYLRKWIGPLPAKSITPRMCESRYQKLAEQTPARAASIMRIGRRAFGRARFLVDPGSSLFIGKADNPFSELDLKGTESEGRIWTRLERAQMVDLAFRCGYPSIGVAIELNYWLGQREGDVLALGRTALDGTSLEIRQNKTKQRVELPVEILPKVHALFARAIEIQRERGVESLSHLLVNEDNGEPWNEHAFRKAFRKVRRAAAWCAALENRTADARALLELWFMALRHTAVVAMQDAGCEISEIAAVTGHSLTSVHTILERYGRRTRKQAENAIRKRLAQEEADGAG